MNEISENIPNGSTVPGGGGVPTSPALRHANDVNTNGSYNNTIVIDNQPKRRVSIASDPAAESRHMTGGYDNPAFEQNPRRKISQVNNKKQWLKKALGSYSYSQYNYPFCDLNKFFVSGSTITSRHLARTTTKGRVVK